MGTKHRKHLENCHWTNILVVKLAVRKGNVSPVAAFSSETIHYTQLRGDRHRIANSSGSHDATKDFAVPAKNVERAMAPCIGLSN